MLDVKSMRGAEHSMYTHTRMLTHTHIGQLIWIWPAGCETVNNCFNTQLAQCVVCNIPSKECVGVCVSNVMSVSLHFLLHPSSSGSHLCVLLMAFWFFPLLFISQSRLSSQTSVLVYVTVQSNKHESQKGGWRGDMVPPLESFSVK